jgi:hypothetical protein
MTEEFTPIEGETVSEDGLAHFDITAGPDVELDTNAKLEDVEAAEESAEALEEEDIDGEEEEVE